MKKHKEECSQPVTTIVQHDILEGRAKDFEAWSEKIRAACRRYEGYMGTEVIQPVTDKNNKTGDSNTYVCIFRFDSFANLETWMEAPERKAIVAEASAFSARGPHYHQYRSLEFMFPPTGSNPKPPSREKMAVVTYLGLIAPVFFVPPLVTSYVTDQPFLATLVSLAIITPTMVYAIMPVLTKLFRPWLQK